ncbi:MAG: hypothetical protein AAF629_22395 [Chloroflexota bacterium]
MVNKVGNASWKSFITTPTLLRDIANLTVPAFFINAGSDIRPNWPAQQLAHLMQKGVYIEIPEATHHIWVTHPTELARELQCAIEEISSLAEQV